MASPPGRTPLLRNSITQQKCCLTASLSVSCYGDSAGRIALVGEVRMKIGRLGRKNALLPGLEVAANK